MDIDEVNEVKEEAHDKSQLPDTQKIDSDYCSCDVDDNINMSVWGRLYPVGFNLQPQDLIDSVYTFGRGPECDIQLTSQNMELQILPLISKVQFKLQLEKDNVGSNLFSLLDLSSNGTFVNKKKIGKNNKIYLSDNDEIALSQPQNKAYLFVDALVRNSWLPVSETRNYCIISDLGKGAFGEVKLAIDKSSNLKRYAIKRILKNLCQAETENKIANEIKILGCLNHQCTIKMEDVFENDKAVFIVLEYMPGGDLRQRLRKIGTLNEKDAKFLFYQLVLAVQYLHKEGIIHRDLKPENVLLWSSESNETLLKISDFGLSKIMRSQSTLKTFCGTLMYTAPEILLSVGCKAYTRQVDVWSLGCILYLCLTGNSPFDSKGPMPIQEKIVRGYYQPIRAGPNQITGDAIDLVEKMLIINPTQRITVNDMMKHPWLQDKLMKNKVEYMLLHTAKENLENVSPEFENEKKRRRTEYTHTMIP